MSHVALVPLDVTLHASVTHAWVNDPEERRWSFDPRYVPWFDHVRYLRSLGPREAWVVVETDLTQPRGRRRLVGFVRVVLGELSVTLDRRHRGRGVGRRAVRLGCYASGLAEVVAQVKPGNERSRRAFLAAGFAQQVGGEYNWRRDG